MQRPWLFPQLVDDLSRWLVRVRHRRARTSPSGYLLLAEAGAAAAREGLRLDRPRTRDSREPVLLPILRRFDPIGLDRGRPLRDPQGGDGPAPTKSHLNHVVLDGADGNTWEEGLARLLEDDKRVQSYVKNERLGFTIPYVHKGRSHEYVPDFLVRLETDADDDDERTLIVEVSGSRKSPGPDRSQGRDRSGSVVRAVNNQGDFGRWGYVEIHNPLRSQRCSTTRSRTSTPTSRSSALPGLTSKRTDAAAGSKKLRPDAGRGDHPRRQAGQPADRRRSRLRRARARAADSVRYPRDPTLDPQLVWKGKDELDGEDLVADAPQSTSRRRSTRGS